MKKTLIIACYIICGLLAPAGAATVDDLLQAQSDTAYDYDLMAEWVSDNFAEGLARASAGGILMPASVCRTTGFEFGFFGGFEVWDLDLASFRAMPVKTITVQSSSAVDMPSSVLFPAGGAHFKVGIPGGFDIGLKYGEGSYENTENNSSYDAESSIYGFEIRKHMFGRKELSGLLLPDISLNLTVDGTSGKIKKIETYSQTTAEIYNNNTYAQTINSDTRWETKWDSGQAGLKAVISKNFVLLTPYAGIGVGKNFGKTKTTITSTGTLTLDPEFGFNQSIALNSVSKSEAKSDDFLVNYSFGAEFNIFVVSVGLNYQANKDSHSAYLGLRYQFR